MIFGSTGPTIVWSRAARNIPSRTAPRISSLARCERPSAGSSATDGPFWVWSGNDSMGELHSGVGAARGSLVDGFEVVAVRGRLDLGREGPSEASEGLQHDRPLLRGQPSDDGAHGVALGRLGLREGLDAGRGRLDDDEASIVGDA